MCFCSRKQTLVSSSMASSSETPTMSFNSKAPETAIKTPISLPGSKLDPDYSEMILLHEAATRGNISDCLPLIEVLSDHPATLYGIFFNLFRAVYYALDMFVSLVLLCYRIFVFIILFFLKFYYR